MQTPEVGDVLRLRNWTTASADGRAWRSYSCGGKRDERQVGVAILLGFEPLVMGSETDRSYLERVESSLVELGFVRVTKALDAGADPVKMGIRVIKPGPPVKLHFRGAGTHRVHCGMYQTGALAETDDWGMVTCKRCLCRRKK